MQGREYDYDYAARSEIQAARLLNNNAKKGCNWKANKVYQISVLNFHFKKGDKSEMSWYTMRDSKGGIMEAKAVIKKMSEEESNWFRQNSIDIGRRDYYSGLSAAKEKGMEQGRVEGAAQKAIETAVIAVKKFHIPIDDVAREYGVDKSEIESRLHPATAN
jgi:hypothetical protein